jgi:D-serine deaminase-like pyridoxal phosphate-dependent protein
MPQVAHRQIAAGAVGLTVAKLGEAEVFVEAGVNDVRLAYPIWGEAKWNRFCDLAERASLSVCADSLEVFEGIARSAAAHGLSIPVLIEVDTGFGRCGVQSEEEAKALAAGLESLKGVELIGVMSFAGQSYGQPARVREVALEDCQRLMAIADSLRGAGFGIREVSVGGTPTAKDAAGCPGVTEIRPGTYVFSDRDQVGLGWGTLDGCALTIQATVVSCPRPGRAILDAGTKTLGADAAATAGGFGAVRDHPEWLLSSISEEHGILTIPEGESATIGDRMEVIPNHACGAINMHDFVYAVRGEKVEDRWRVAARGSVQ